MVKTDPKITSRKVILDSDDELKESAVKPNTTSELSLSAPATAEATIVTLPNSDQVSVTNAPANPPTRVPASRALGEFWSYLRQKNSYMAIRLLVLPKNGPHQSLSLQTE